MKRTRLGGAFMPKRGVRAGKLRSELSYAGKFHGHLQSCPTCQQGRLCPEALRLQTKIKMVPPTLTLKGVRRRARPARGF